MAKFPHYIIVKVSSADPFFLLLIILIKFLHNNPIRTDLLWKQKKIRKTMMKTIKNAQISRACEEGQFY